VIRMLVVLAAILPVFGPAIDHHFYERLSSHSHVYMDKNSLDHDHVHEPEFTDSKTDDQKFIAFASDGALGHSGTPHIISVVTQQILQLTVTQSGRSVEVSEFRHQVKILPPVEPPRVPTVLDNQLSPTGMVRS